MLTSNSVGSKDWHSAVTDWTVHLWVRLEQLQLNGTISAIVRTVTKMRSNRLFPSSTPVSQEQEQETNKQRNNNNINDDDIDYWIINVWQEEEKPEKDRRKKRQDQKERPRPHSVWDFRKKSRRRRRPWRHRTVHTMDQLSPFPVTLKQVCQHRSDDTCTRGEETQGIIASLHPLPLVPVSMMENIRNDRSILLHSWLSVCRSSASSPGTYCLCLCRLEACAMCSL